MGGLDALRQFTLIKWLREERQSRKLILFIVFVALLLDNMLLTVVVPIIPSYLYNLDESADVEIRNGSLSPQAPSGSFHAIVSLYDNSVRLSGSNSTVGTADPARPTPAHAPLPRNSSDCPQSTSRLLNENVKVGMLFASKATVQLLTNPFIGPLTNRYGSALLRSVSYRSSRSYVELNVDMRLSEQLLRDYASYHFYTLCLHVLRPQRQKVIFFSQFNNETITD
ncbi:PREDICTED: synaptic vesicular amine transporter [Poecilia mexicana]|uniref:Uncharacterized protein n=1 Tax=Poecilia mexicana TaxID=48701 RepID=A0A3B3Y2M4_9TELE|nr:PREDICTED: synaptic vesicular amine transporter [Poecilia mexicana]